MIAADVDAVSVAGQPADRVLARLFDPAWPSYLLVAVLQMKVIWGIWKYRDMTSGDTAAYFDRAYLWSHHLQVDILWSPLYTAYYGTLLGLTGDPITATWLHRLLIVMAATLGVLAVGRRVLTPPIALAVAVWWAVLPINFNTLYEIHLFALCAILCAWLIAGYVDTPLGRGVALGQFIVTAVLVRNEYTVAAVTFAAASLYREYRSLKRLPAGLPAAALNRLWAYVVPVGLALALCLGAYSRSIIKGKDLLPELHFKLTFNPCQLYAVGYKQRHPDWSKDPWHDCYDLQQAIFGAPLPTLGQMARANPQAVLGHFGWNLLLVPAGLQLALFNGTWGGPNPDFVPLEHPDDPMAVLLTFVVLGAAACGCQPHPRASPVVALVLRQARSLDRDALDGGRFGANRPNAAAAPVVLFPPRLV